MPKLLEPVSESRLGQLAAAFRMEEFDKVLEHPPTLAEISSIATELKALRSAPTFHDELETRKAI